MANKEAGDLDVAIGKKIRKARVERGITMAKLGDACGVSYYQMQKYEKGVNRLTVSRLVLLCKFLGIPVQDIVQCDDISEDYSKLDFVHFNVFGALSKESKKTVHNLAKELQ